MLHVPGPQLLGSTSVCFSQKSTFIDLYDCLGGTTTKCVTEDTEKNYLPNATLTKQGLDYFCQHVDGTCAQCGYFCQHTEGMCAQCGYFCQHIEMCAQCDYFCQHIEGMCAQCGYFCQHIEGVCAQCDYLSTHRRCVCSV